MMSDSYGLKSVPGGGQVMGVRAVGERSVSVRYLVLAVAIGLVATLASLMAAACHPSDDPTPETLWEAARRGDQAAVQRLIEAGVDVDAKTAYGATALSFAADRGHVEIVRYLLSQQADPNTQDTFYNATPMAWATMGNRYEIVRALVLAGADDVDTALRMAVKQRDLETVQAIAAGGKATRPALRAGARLAEQIADEEFGADVVAAIEAALDRFYPQVKLDPAILAAYEGTYLSDAGVRLDVARDEQVVTIQLAPGPRVEIDAISATEFSTPQGRLTFERDDAAGLTAILSAGEAENRFRRLSQPEVDALPKPEVDAAAAAASEIASDRFPASSPQSLAADLAVSSANWPQFRGGGARGLAEGQQPPTRWNDAESLNLAWRTPIPGLGHSCPVVWEGRIFVTSAISGQEADLRIGLYGDVTSVEDDSEHQFITVCISAETGEVLWQKTACRRVPSVKRHLKSTHANSTVATDGEHVVAWFGSEGVYCYSLDGELIWEKDLGLLDSGWFYDRDYQWQFGASPIIHDGRLILQCDIQDQSFLAMFDVATGEQIWRTERDEIPSWSTPTVVATPTGLQIVTNATGAARGYDFATGQQLWRIGGNSEIVVPTPIAAHGLVYVSSGYRPIQPIYAIRLDAAGDLTLADGESQSEYVAWSESRSGPYMPSPIAYGDYLYVCSNSGILTCFQAKTGELVYKKRLPMQGDRSFVGSPVAADGHLFFTSEEGETAVVKAGPIFELVANNHCGEICLTTPAISRGTFYLRGQRHLFAFRQIDPLPAEHATDAPR